MQLRGSMARTFRLIQRWEQDGWDPTRESNEILHDGPAGTGKTFGLLNIVDYLWEQYPGIHIAFSREKEIDINKSIAVEFEEAVLGPDHPAVNDGRTRHRRKLYNHPNGSTIFFRGFDDDTRWRSTQFDMLYTNEGIELDLSDWETAASRVRRFHIPFQPCMIDTNPDRPGHWLNKRPDEKHDRFGYPKMHRFTSRHEDNPKYYSIEDQDWTREGLAYVEGVLGGLSGIRRQRFKDGLWVAAEGLVWPEFNPAIHIADRLPERPGGDAFVYRFASLDWGFVDPGVMQVWGRDDDGTLWLIHEVYQTGRSIAWWVDQAKGAMKDLGVTMFACPDDRPDHIAEFQTNAIPVYEIKRRNIKMGLELVRDRFATQRHGRPGIYFYRYALSGADQGRIEQKKPFNTVQEIEEYVYQQIEDGKVVREEPDKLCEDHGCDAARYAMTYVHEMDAAFSRPESQYDTGTYGQVLNEPKTPEEFEEAASLAGWSLE